MKRTAFVLAFTLLIASPLVAQSPITFEDLMAVRRVGAPHLSPDGKWIAYDVSEIDLGANVRRSAVYLLGAKGGPPRKITDGAKQDEGPAWSPDGKTLAYTSNRDGGPKQVYLYDVAAGTSRKLTSLASGAASVKWAPDGSAILLVSDVYPECGIDPACIKGKSEADAKRMTKARVIDGLLYRHWSSWQEPTRAHIIYYPLSGSPLDLTPGAFDAPPFSLGGGDEFDISPDGKEVVYARDSDAHPEMSTNSDLFIVARGGAEAKRITTRKGADTSPKYSPDGKWIAYRSQSRAGYESDLWELWLYNRATSSASRVAADFPNWINSVTWSPDSRSMYVTSPLEGNNVIFEVTLSGKFSQITGAGSADAVAVARDGKTLYFQRSSLSMPAEIWSITKGKMASRAMQITRENDTLMQRIAMGEAESIWWSGADGARVQGHVILPPSFDRSRKYPALLLIHGGPQGAWSNSWSYRWNPQMFAARGYVVFMPNPRGSTGFGQKFIEEISRDWAGKVYTDIMNGVDALVSSRPYVDANRLGAAGASYGGYMVNWILGHSERFKALVSHAGVYNLDSMYGVTEELWFPEWEFGGNPWDNPELYEKWSPHRFVKNFKTPTLVTHGELDYRVPIGEGFQLFTALQRRGVPSKFLYYPDEGHWILKPQNSRLWYQTVGDWLDQWLKTKDGV